jgi:pyrroline-5-carboxylate reductase
LLLRLLRSERFEAGASDVFPERLRRYEEVLWTTSSNRELTGWAELVVLAVKPHELPAALGQITSVLEEVRKPVVSVAAGVRIQRIENELPEGTPVLRVMPNLGMSIGLGTAVVAANEAGGEHLPLVLEVFGSVGEAMELPEELFDAATALHGSGPAYVALLADALVQAGVREGLPRDVARRLAVGTIVGAGGLMESQGPNELRDEVMTPGGTTAAAFAALEKDGFAAAVYDAIEAATSRARDIGS